MAGIYRRLRYLAAGSAFGAMTAFALVPSADAQWLPFGAAPPREIVQRLRAEGYVLVGPLRRRDTVYLADVVGGPVGRERLVIDAWSGEILQRFVARSRGFVPEGGEFSEPPPLGPPPPRDFREGNYGYGAGAQGGLEAPPPVFRRRRGRPGRGRGPLRRPARARSRAGRRRPRPPPNPPRCKTPEPAVPLRPLCRLRRPPPPRTAASPPNAPANPSVSEPARAEPSPPKAAAAPATESQSKPAAAPASPAEAKQASRRPPQRSPKRKSTISRSTRSTEPKKGRPCGRPFDLPGSSLTRPASLPEHRSSCSS